MPAFEPQIQKLWGEKDYPKLVKLLFEIKGNISNLEKEDFSGKSSDLLNLRKAHYSGLELLQQAVPEIAEILNTPHGEPETTVWLLRAFKLLPSVNLAEAAILLETMVKHEDRTVRDAAFQILMEDKEPDDSPGLPRSLCDSVYIADKIEDLLKYVSGNRLAEFLPAVIAKAANPRLTESSLRASLMYKSPLVKKNCDLVDRRGDKFFMAFEFANRLVADVIGTYFGKHSPPYHMQIAGRAQESFTISGEIVTKLLGAAFAVFDLSPSKKFHLNPFRLSKLPNYNVVLELGLALALGIPCILLVRRGTFQITDLQGWQHIEYKRIHDIPREMAQKFPPDNWHRFLRNYE